MKRVRAAALAMLTAGLLAACAGAPTATVGPASTSPATSPAPAGTTSSMGGATSGTTSAPTLGGPSAPVPPSSTVPATPVRTSGSPGARLTLRGTVEAGVEHGCLVLTDRATGKRFTLTAGKPAIVKAGADISVVGVLRTDLMSYCQQGPIFQVLTATPNK